jgi:Leucine-rich repeat (LRR) protein
MKKLLLLLLFIFISATATAQIVNIPDANFKAQLIAIGVDTNADGQIQNTEALAVTTLNVITASIFDMTGIEAFTNLQTLECSYNQLTTLNVQGLTNLLSLYCKNNHLTTLNVQGLTNLQTLDCSYNQLTTLDVQGLTNLQTLGCPNNQLTTLDVQGLTNLQTLGCTNNQLTTLNVQGLTNLETLDCSTNQLPTLDVQGLTNLRYLYCSYNQLPTLDVQGLTNLQEIYCQNNQLTTLNVQGLTNLQEIYCENNQLTALNVQGLTNLGILFCINNQLPTLNVQGLTNLVYLYCFNNQLTTLNVQGLTNLLILNCSYNQLPTLDVQGLTNPETLDCSYNQLTTLNVQGLNLGTLNCSNNQLPTLDIQGLTNLYTLNCSYNQLPTLDIQGLTNLYFLYCYNNQLTSLFIKNGHNKTIVFYGNPNLTYICADDSEITSVQNLATGYGYTSCNVNGYCSFTPGGIFYTINGSNKFDSNNNGCDASDISFPNLKFTMTDGTNTGGLIADTTGNYTIPVQAGTHTLTPVLENPSYFTVSPATATVTFPAATSTFTQDFCMAPNGVHPDLEVVVSPVTPARPGFNAVYNIVYKNKGNQTFSGDVSFAYDDAVLDFVSATVAPSSQSTGVVNWSYSNLLPFENRSIYVTLNVNAPTETPPVNISDILNITTNITPQIGDEIPADNVFTINQTVVGSYDPNNKICLEGNTVSPTKIGDYLHYNINFENTGTAAAQNIVVKDIIDITNFDIYSLQIMNSSNPMTTRITGNKVEFIFENINLGATQHGNVIFKIRTKNTLVTGNTVTNKADIYFDYNFPVETNTESTTFQTLSSNQFIIDNSVSISPNPTNSKININANSNIKSIELYDVQGRVLKTVLENTNQSVLDISDKANGIYFLKITTENGSKIEKVVKE